MAWVGLGGLRSAVVKVGGGFYAKGVDFGFVVATDLVCTDEELDFQVVCDIIVDALRVAGNQARSAARGSRDECWGRLKCGSRRFRRIRHVGEICLPTNQ